MANKIDCRLADINTRDILVDEKGQRDVNRRKTQFAKIMREFDQNLVQPISVAQIDGRFWCFDGQMTMKVLKAKNGGRDLNVKCRVYRGMTKLDAAMMFTKQRGITSNVTPAEKIRVLVNYGDESAVDFLRTTEWNGLEISWNGSSSRNAVVAVSSLWDEYVAFNDSDMYGSFIRVIRGAWDGDPAGAQSKILKGVGLFMRTYKGQFREDILIQKLKLTTPDEIIRNAKSDRSQGARKYAVQVLLLYNTKQRVEKRLPNLL